MLEPRSNTMKLGVHSATLAGDATSFTDTDVAAGLHFVAVTDVVA